MKLYRLGMGLGMAFAVLYDVFMDAYIYFEQGLFDGFGADFDVEEDDSED